MATQPLSTKTLIAKRREEAVGRLLRATNPDEKAGLEKSIQKLDRLDKLFGGRDTSPEMKVDLNAPSSGMSVQTPPTPIKFPKTISARTQLRASHAPTGATPETPLPETTTEPEPILGSQPASSSPIEAPPQGGMSPEQVLSAQYGEALAKPAPSIPSPEDLSIGDRMSLAAAGALNPQFFESVVAPQIQSRHPTVEGQLKRQQAAQAIKSQQLEDIRGQVPIQNLALEREKFDYEKARTQQELHAGFTHLSHEIMGSDGTGEGDDSLVQTIAEGARAAQAAGLLPEAKNLLRYGAVLKSIREHDADYRKAIGMPPIPSGPGDLQYFAGQAREAKAALDDVYGRIEQQRNAAALAESRNKVKIPPARQKEMDDYNAIIQTAQGILGRRQMLGDIGGIKTYVIPKQLYSDAMNDEEADLSLIRGALGHILGGGGNLTKIERDLYTAVYTNLSDVASKKEANLHALIRFSTMKLNGLAMQYGLSQQKGDSVGNELDVERVRADGGVLVGHSADDNPIFQMPNGELREVTP